MPRVRRRGYSLRGELTSEQTWALLIGPTGGEFASEAEQKAAWYAHREALLADVTPTTRPWAFWQYEQGGKHPRHGTEAAVLAAGGLLTPAEVALLARWRKDKEIA